MTVEEAIALLQREDPKAEVYVCHFAKFGTRACPRIHPLADIAWIDGRLVLVEADDRKLFLASV